MSADTAAAAAVHEDLVLREDADGIATLTLNRPKQYNALSMDMMAALQAQVGAIHDDRSVKAVVIEGAGRGFCAGHDLRELRSQSDRGFYQEVFQTCSHLMLSITRMPQPVVAKVHGIATAAGCQLVATCDLAVAAESARFATPGVNIGLFCSTPMVAVSRAVPRKTAMEMLLTGEMLPAARAAEVGLVNRVVADDELDGAVAEFVRAITAKSPLTLKIGKEAFYRQLELGLEEAYSYTSEVMTQNMLARDAEEGIDAFLEKRDPSWQGR